MASQQLQQPLQANQNAAAEDLAAIRQAAFTAERVDKLDSEQYVSLRVAALKAAMAVQDVTWQERMGGKDAAHQGEVAALRSEIQSLKARLSHEEWTGPEQILNEDLQLVRTANIKLRAQEKNLTASLKRAHSKIQNDTAKIDTLEKESKELKERYASLKKETLDVLARHI